MFCHGGSRTAQNVEMFSHHSSQTWNVSSIQISVLFDFVIDTDCLLLNTVEYHTENFRFRFQQQVKRLLENVNTAQLYAYRKCICVAMCYMYRKRKIHL